MLQPEIAIVILNWNRPSDTAECLRSLSEQTYNRWHAVVVDNGSTDDSVAVLSASFPGLDIIKSERNLGFAGGCNLGVRKALAGGADFVFLLNNDTSVDAQCLSLLVAACRNGFSVLAPIVYYHAEPARLWSGGARQGRWLAVDLTEPDLLEDTVAVDFITGCAMLVHRSVFEAIGLLDERFFMFYEDLEFCTRARRAGFAIGVVSAARVWHKVGLSLSSDRPRDRYLRVVSGIRYYSDELHGWRRLLLAWWLLKRAKAALSQDLQNRHWANTAAWFAGLRDGLRMWHSADHVS